MRLQPALKLLWLQPLESHNVSWAHEQHSTSLVDARWAVPHLQVHMLWACSSVACS